MLQSKDHPPMLSPISFESLKKINQHESNTGALESSSHALDIHNGVVLKTL